MVIIEWLPLVLLFLIILIGGIAFGGNSVTSQVDDFLKDNTALNTYRKQNFSSVSDEQFQRIVEALRRDASSLRFHFRLRIFLIGLPICMVAAYIFLRPYQSQIQQQLNQAYETIAYLQSEMVKAGGQAKEGLQRLNARFRPDVNVAPPSFKVSAPKVSAPAPKVSRPRTPGAVALPII
jgi:hypothetical protein